MATGQAFQMRRRSPAPIGSACLLAATCAGVVPCTAATAFAVTPPPGFAVERLPDDEPYTAEDEVSSTSEPDVGCQVAFDPSQAMPGVDQPTLDRAADSPRGIARFRAFVAETVEVERVEPFSMQGVIGLVAWGRPKVRIGDVRMLAFRFQTPPGRTVLSCAIPSPRFGALRPTFEAIARGVTLPR